YTNYSPTTNVDQILQSRVRNDLGKIVYSRNDEGDVILGEEKKGVPLSDVWNIPFLNPKASERSGYPTQKPILLLEKIIEISTEKGDCVLDPMCGSGTTLVSAKLADRKYIGIDISSDATEMTKARLLEPIKTESRLLDVGEESYLDKSDYERTILKSIDAIPVERNSGIDGFIYLDAQHIPVKIQKHDESLEVAKRKLINASKNKNSKLMILVRTQKEVENSLFAWADENVLVIDSHDFQIKELLNKFRNVEIKISLLQIDNLADSKQALANHG
ncbi:MAG: DNA methyltransferase, partial [Chloroflexi bacterium]|nr:DNA methyltransferase [Chloroflexota bacterium]